MTKIEELRDAYNAGTHGEWEIYDTYEALLCNEDPPRDEWVTEIQSRNAGNSPCYGTSLNDAHLITLMHNNLPSLLEAAEALAFVSLVIDGGGECDEGSACDVMRKALAKLK